MIGSGVDQSDLRDTDDSQVDLKISKKSISYFLTWSMTPLPKVTSVTPKLTSKLKKTIS